MSTTEGADDDFALDGGFKDPAMNVADGFSVVQSTQKDFATSNQALPSKHVDETEGIAQACDSVAVAAVGRLLFKQALGPD